MAIPNPAPELPFFTNRSDEIKLFHQWVEKSDASLTAENSALPLLMFYGVGGCGKSYLRLQLRNELAQTRPEMPIVELDFNIGNEASVSPQSRWQTLLAIRVFLAVPCPRFDKAMAIYMSRQNNSASSAVLNPRMENYADAGSELAASLFYVVPGVGFGVKKLVQYLARLEAGKNPDLQRLSALDTGSLYERLMSELQDDLNQYLPPHRDAQPARCRAVVFLDSFEYFEGMTETASEQNSTERWICDLAAGLPHVLCVLSGRNRLNWSRPAGNGALWLQETHVGGFTETYALHYLGLRGITSAFEPLQKTILATCDIKNEPGYHPLSLQICADTALRLKQSNGQFPAADAFQLAPDDFDGLVNRFLLALDADEAEALKRLAFTLRFDGAAGEAACKGNTTTWDYLSTLSLLSATGQGDWQIMHDLVRCSLLDANARDTRNGARRSQERHEFWREYWQNRMQGSNQ